MPAYIKGGILGGIVIFVWCVISWMVLPWHMTTLNAFKNEKVVADVIIPNATQSGIYIFPIQMEPESTTNSQAVKPFMFASLQLEGRSHSMIVPMAIDLISTIIVSILVAWMLMHTFGFDYWGRVGFVMVFAIAASIISYVPYWNWFGFNTRFILLGVGDLLIGWFLAGLILAKFTDRQQSRPIFKT